MIEIEEGNLPPVKRSGIARIGIAALNIFQPGLGLLRLSKWRPAGLFWLLSFAVLLTLFLAFHTIQEMTFTVYYVLLAALTLSIVGVALGSIIVTWRNSATVDPSPKWWSRWYGLVIIYLTGAALTLSAGDLRSYYRNFYAASASMAPTIKPEDKFVAKMRNFGVINRGDILVVKAKDSEYVTRVVALPGDTVLLMNGVIFLNDSIVRQTPTKKNLGSTRPADAPIIFSEQLPGEKSSHTIVDEGYSSQDDWPKTKLGPKEYFFLGDNRDNSADSRFGLEMLGLGIVSEDRILGRVIFRYWRKGSGYGEGKI